MKTIIALTCAFLLSTSLLADDAIKIDTEKKVGHRFQNIFMGNLSNISVDVFTTAYGQK